MGTVNTYSAGALVTTDHTVQFDGDERFVEAAIQSCELLT
jgi:hypothetical protein